MIKKLQNYFPGLHETIDRNQHDTSESPLQSTSQTNEASTPGLSDELENHMYKIFDKFLDSE